MRSMSAQTTLWMDKKGEMTPEVKVGTDNSWDGQERGDNTWGQGQHRKLGDGQERGDNTWGQGQHRKLGDGQERG